MQLQVRTLPLVIASLLLASSAGAYVRSTTTNTHTPLAWFGSNCVYVRVNSTGSDDIADDSEIAAAKRAIDNWRKVIGTCSYLKFLVQDDSPDAKPGFTRSGENENVIYFEESAWQHEKMAAAITTVFFLEKQGSDQDGRILDADIELNGQWFHFSTTGSLLRTDVENTVTHELGHVMGLDHPCDDGARQPVPKDDTGKTIPTCTAVMSSNTPGNIAIREATMFNFADPGETKKRTPEADDIRGICEIYPMKSDPGSCSPVTYDDGGGCSMAGMPGARGAAEPRSGAERSAQDMPARAVPWILLLATVLVVLRRR